MNTNHMTELRDALQSAESIVRARAAEKIGRRKITECADALLAALPNAIDDTCSILDALGFVGDPSAIPVLREYAQRKLLSRRRSAVEALRNLNDWDGLNESRNRALERLPDTVRDCLSTVDENETGDGVQQLIDIYGELQQQQQGLTLDTFYELATPAPTAVVWHVLQNTTYARPHIWRYVKSVFKRATLRGDYTTFGMIAHQVERQGRGTAGMVAVVKSGYDGESRQTHIFNRSTQKYLRRGAWRYLRRLARNNPDAYPWAAAAALIPYAPDDAQLPKGLNGRFASCYVLGQILWGESDRFKVDNRSLRRRFRDANSLDPRPGEREETFPELWDAQPRAYLQILGGAKLPEAHDFALAAIRDRHMNLVQMAKHSEIIGMIRTDYEPTLHLALGELERRFDPQKPDWSLIDQLAEHDREIARVLAGRWLNETVSQWVTVIERVVRTLAYRQADVRNVAAELVVAHLPKDADLRKPLAERVLAELQKPEETQGRNDGFARVARSVLLDEIDRRLQLTDVLGLIDSGNLSAQALAGDLLARHPEAIEELGLEKLTLLAQHEIVTVRQASHQLIRSASDKLRQDPSVLLVLVESDWDDTRELAFEMLNAMCKADAVSDELLLGLLDSNRTDVQNTACGIARELLPKLNQKQLIEKLLEHPDAGMRWFVMELIDKQLQDVPLGSVEKFFRNALLDLTPDARLKRRILNFVIDQGLQSEDKATIAIRILGEIARVKGRTDFETALEGLVRLSLQYPHIASPVSLHMEGVA